MLFLYTLTLFYHMGNGIRHLVWDFGYGFDLEVARASGAAVLAFAGAHDRAGLAGRRARPARSNRRVCRTPLSPGRAASEPRTTGLGHWKAQRLTALANVVLVLWFVFSAAGARRRRLRTRYAPGWRRRSRRR